MESAKVLLACALGAFIGALVALQMWQPFWWVGLIIGGLVGYVAYQPMDVVRAVPLTWSMATTKRARVRWRAFFRAWFGHNCFMSNIYFVTAIFVATLTKPGHKFQVALTIFLGSAGFMMVISTPAMAASKLRHQREWYYTARYNPIFLCLFYIPKWLFRGTIALASALAKYARHPYIPMTIIVVMRMLWVAAVFIATFLRHMFILIHSDIRLLCGLDAALGAGIGYLAGHALVGAIAGGVIGVLNFEIISKRWLHLVAR